MTDNLHLLLGEVRGELRGLREDFGEMKRDISDLKEHKTTRQAEGVARGRLIEAGKWVVAVVIAAVSGHVAGQH